MPIQTVTFLFADLEGSTRLLETLGARYASLLADLRHLLETTFQQWRGQTVDAAGDGLFVVFPSARDALAAALAAQRAIEGHAWPTAAVHVRMGVHTGEPVHTGTGYVGLDVNRAARICAAGHGGQILVSATAHMLIDHDLPDGVSLRDLGEHLLKDLAQPQHLYQVVAADLPQEFPPLRTLATLPNNLPIQVTSFIGREREITELRRRFATTHLLTLTGTGGSGKTRLALHLAAEMLDEFPDGVWLVELATVTDPTLVPQAVAGALGIHEQPSRAIQATVLDYVRSRHLLLVLDNCEHVIAACAQLTAALLRACPDLRILITSREPLGTAGEVIWPVPPLSVPELERGLPVNQLRGFEAVRLFVERARAVQPGFDLTTQNAAAVASLCERLDGIPLALELAAARVKVLPVDEIGARLHDRFRLLTGGSRTALPRHQTLRATMDWSYELLTEPERVLFRRLSVFVGGFTLDAAEVVCSERGLPSQEILDLLTRLVDKSLVLMDARDGAARYRMLATVWQYSQDKLLSSGEAPDVRLRHRDWYMQLATTAEPELQGTAQKLWLDRLEVEHDNLRAALDWSQAEPGGADATIQTAAALWWFWFVRGYWTEGRERLEHALKLPGTTAAARAKALTGAGVLAGRQGEYRRAVTLGEESLALYQGIKDVRGIAFSQNLLGYLARLQGNYERAATLCGQALLLAREVNDIWGTALALFIMGEVALIQGDYLRARSLLVDSLAAYLKRGDTWGVGFAQNNLGLVARQQGDLNQAELFCSDSLKLFRELDEKWGIASALRSLGIIAHGKGEYARAKTLFEDSLSLYRELGDKWGIASSLRSLGLIAHHGRDDHHAGQYLEESLSIFQSLNDLRGIADTLQSLGVLARDGGEGARAEELWRESLGKFAQVQDKLGIAQCLRFLSEAAATRGEFERAARLCGALEHLRGALGVPVDRYASGMYDRALDDLRAHLPAPQLTAALAEGKSMALDQLVAYVLTDAARRHHNKV